MSWYKDNDSTITLKVIVTNLYTLEDYEKISMSIKEIKGVDSIANFQPQQITITFNQNQTSLEQIVYIITKMGYRYV